MKDALRTVVRARQVEPYFGDSRTNLDAKLDYLAELLALNRDVGFDWKLAEAQGDALDYDLLQAQTGLPLMTPSGLRAILDTIFRMTLVDEKQAAYLRHMAVHVPDAPATELWLEPHAAYLRRLGSSRARRSGR